MSQVNKSGEVETNGTGDSDSEQKPQKRQVKHDSGAADLEKVTDYMEDSEISSQNIEQVSHVRLFSAQFAHFVVVLLLTGG
jgi:hypothetical protein